VRKIECIFAVCFDCLQHWQQRRWWWQVERQISRLSRRTWTSEVHGEFFALQQHLLVALSAASCILCAQDVSSLVCLEYLIPRTYLLSNTLICHIHTYHLLSDTLWAASEYVRHEVSLPIFLHFYLKHSVILSICSFCFFLSSCCSLLLGFYLGVCTSGDLVV